MSEIKKQIIQLAHSLKSFVVYGEGNVSGKLDDIFYIKPSGFDLFNLKNKDLIKCDINGVQISNFLKKPSMETSFHSFLLKNYDVNFIAHTHPTETMKILCSDKIFTFAEKRLFPDQIVRNSKKSCVVPYANPGEQLTHLLKKHLNIFCKKEGYFPKLILLKNHGIICAGKTIKECLVSTEICEKSAKIFIGANSVGNINFLTPLNIDDIENCPAEKHRNKLLKR